MGYFRGSQFLKKWLDFAHKIILAVGRISQLFQKTDFIKISKSCSRNQIGTKSPCQLTNTKKNLRN